MTELYTMSKKEVQRLEVIQKLLSKQIRQMKASEMLNISIRQIQRLLEAYRANGAAGIISRKRAKVSNNKISDTIKDYAITLIKQHYKDFGPTLAAEKLLEKHDLKVSVETVRNLMTKAEIWIPKNKKYKRSYQPRYRRECFGELIQIDGSLHHWFENRGTKCTLLVYVDDATSKLTNLYFAPSESMHTHCIATKGHIERYGKPIAFYSDKLSVFRYNSNAERKNKNKIMTQFGRALYELNIDLICANTCQAKGRVERANLTLQDRLVKELRLNNISTISAANDYLPTFIEDYNKRFGKEPQSSTDMHRLLKPHEDLYETLCVKESRIVSNSLTIQYDRVLYLIEDALKNRKLRRQKITLNEHYDGKISLNYKDTKLNFSKLYDKAKPVEQGEIISNERIADTLILIKAKQQEKENEFINKIEHCNSIPNDRIGDTLKLIYQQQKQKQSIKEFERTKLCLSRKHLDTNNYDNRTIA